MCKDRGNHPKRIRPLLSERCDYHSLGNIRRVLICPDSELDPILSLVERLVLFGVYPQGTTSLSQVSFFEITGPMIRSSLHHQDGQYTTTWQNVLTNLSPSSLHKVLASWLSYLPFNLSGEHDRSIIKSNATVCKLLFGELSESSETWRPFVSVVINHQWLENHARVAMCWLALSGERGQQRLCRELKYH